MYTTLRCLWIFSRLESLLCNTYYNTWVWFSSERAPWLTSHSFIIFLASEYWNYFNQIVRYSTLTACLVSARYESACLTGARVTVISSRDALSNLQFISLVSTDLIKRFVIVWNRFSEKFFFSISHFNHICWIMQVLQRF